MATKKINDLQLRSSADDTCNLPVDDASQTWRITVAQLAASILGQARITALTAKTAPTADDELILASTSEAAVRKVSKANLFKAIYTTKTANYLVTAADETMICSGASFMLTLPAAASLPGKRYWFKHNDAVLGRVYTIKANASELIDDANTKKLATIGETIAIFSDGTQWQITYRRIPSVPVAFTPSLTTSSGAITNTNSLAKWWRNGAFIRVQGSILFTAGAGTYSILSASIPANLTIDTARMPRTTYSFGDGQFGGGSIVGGTKGDVVVAWGSTSTVNILANFSASGTNPQIVGSAQLTQAQFNSANGMDYYYDLPITDWEG